MTPEQRAQLLANARLAAKWLKGYMGLFVSEPFEFEVLRLIAGFELLDEKEQAQIEAGKLGGPHGGRGGRPRKTKNGGKK